MKKREILFRAKRKDNGEWIYGSLIISKVAGRKHYHIQEEDTAGPRYCFEVIFESIGQFIGAVDKHNKKIFEDDILMPNWCFRKMPIRGYVNKKHPDLIKGYAVVEFDSGGFDFVFKNTIKEHREIYAKHKRQYAYIGYTRDEYHQKQDHVEVCGNIHNNLELLKL